MARDRYHSWMYRGGHPNWWARLLNGIGARQFAVGLGLRNWVTLEVRGRRSGRVISFPMVVADYAGERYLVSMLGANVNWVRNLRAADGRAVIRRGRGRSVRLVEIEPSLRAPILRRYLALAPGARPHVPVDWRAPLEEFAAVADQFPVFRIQPD